MIMFRNMPNLYNDSTPYSSFKEAFQDEWIALNS